MCLRSLAVLWFACFVLVSAGCVQERTDDEDAVERQDAGNDQSHESCVKMRGSYRQVDGVDRVEFELVNDCSSALMVPVSPVVTLRIMGTKVEVVKLQEYFYSMYVIAGHGESVGGMGELHPPVVKYDVHYIIINPGDTSVIAIPLCDSCDDIDENAQSEWKEVGVRTWIVADSIIPRLNQLSRAIDMMPKTLLDLRSSTHDSRLVVRNLNGVSVRGSMQPQVLTIDSQTLFSSFAFKGLSYGYSLWCNLDTLQRDSSIYRQ